MKVEVRRKERRTEMTRVNKQIELERLIDQARLQVKAKKGLRDAMRVGVFRVGNRTFAAIDASNAYEVKGGQLVALTAEEITKYIRPENMIDASYLFRVLTDEELSTLTNLFKTL
jgi:hypothetical protein